MAGTPTIIIPQNVCVILCLGPLARCCARSSIVVVAVVVVGKGGVRIGVGVGVVVIRVVLVMVNHLTLDLAPVFEQRDV